MKIFSFFLAAACLIIAASSNAFARQNSRQEVQQGLRLTVQMPKPSWVQGEPIAVYVRLDSQQRTLSLPDSFAHNLRLTVRGEDGTKYEGIGARKPVVCYLPVYPGGKVSPEPPVPLQSVSRERPLFYEGNLIGRPLGRSLTAGSYELIVTLDTSSYTTPRNVPIFRGRLPSNTVRFNVTAPKGDDEAAHSLMDNLLRQQFEFAGVEPPKTKMPVDLERFVLRNPMGAERVMATCPNSTYVPYMKYFLGEKYATLNAASIYPSKVLSLNRDLREMKPTFPFAAQAQINDVRAYLSSKKYEEARRAAREVIARPVSGFAAQEVHLLFAEIQRQEEWEAKSADEAARQKAKSR